MNSQPSTNNQRALVASILASGTDDLNVMFLAFSMSSIISQLGISGAQAGFIATITNLGMLIGGLVFGVLADRYNRFKVFKWTIVLFSVATGLIFFTPNLSYLYLMRFLAGMGVGGEYGVAIAIMASIVPAQKMGRISSLNGIAGQVGSIASALLAGLFAPMFGWRGLFLFGLLPLVLVLWMILSINDRQLYAETQAQQCRANTDQPASIKELFLTPALTRQTLGLMIMTTVQIAGYFGMMNWLPTMMQQTTGVSVQGSSTWMISTIIGMCLGMLTFGRLLDNRGPRVAYGLFLSMSALAVYGFTFADTPLTMVVGGAIVGFFVNGMFAGYGAMITRLYPDHIASIANNVILNVGRAVGGFSSVAIGWLLDVSSVPMVMFFLACLYIVSLITMLSLENLKSENYQDSSQAIATSH